MRAIRVVCLSACLVIVAVAFFSCTPSDAVVGVSAYYTGDKTPGTMIDDNSDFNVVIGQADGVTRLTDEWTVLNPGPLPNDATEATFQLESHSTTVEVIITIARSSAGTTSKATGAGTITAAAGTGATNKATESYIDLSAYERVDDLMDYKAMVERPVGKKICYSFMVERIYDNGTVELVDGYSGVNPSAIFITNSEYGDQVNDHTEVTVYARIAEDGSAAHAGQHTLCLRVDHLTIDSRELEQYVKPNQISECHVSK